MEIGVREFKQHLSEYLDEVGSTSPSPTAVGRKRSWDRSPAATTLPEALSRAGSPRRDHRGRSHRRRHAPEPRHRSAR